MATTTAELRNKVAEHLRIKGADQELDSERAAIIDNKIDDVSAFLREKGLIWWADDAVPNPAVWPMTLMIAAAAAKPCGKADQGYEAGWTDGQSLMTEIKPSAEIATVRAHYF